LKRGETHFSRCRDENGAEQGGHGSFTATSEGGEKIRKKLEGISPLTAGKDDKGKGGKNKRITA